MHYYYYYIIIIVIVHCSVYLHSSYATVCTLTKCIFVLLFVRPSVQPSRNVQLYIATLANSEGQGQDQGHAHLECEYLANDDRYGLHYYFPQILCRITAFDEYI